MAALVSPDTLIALPGGASVSAQFLAEQGVYQRDPASGQVIAPDDAHAVGFGGTTYAVNQHPDWFPAYTAEDPATRARREEDARRQQAAAAQTSASVRTMLRQRGLEELIGEVDAWIEQGLTWPEIEALLYDPTTNAGKVLDRKYPEIQLLLKAGRPPVSIDQIQEYRQSARSLMRAARLPEGFYDDPSDFTKFIVDGVDITELRERVDGYVFAAYEAPTETLDSMQRLYGVGPEALAAYWMDPDKALPAIQKQVSAAATAGAAVRSGFGQISAAEAERLASVGVTGEAAVQAFGTLTQAGELFAPLPGVQDGSFDRDRQLDLVAGDATAAAEAQRRAARRASETQGGGSFASSQRGVSGIGTAR